VAAPKASFQATLVDIDAVLDELSEHGLEVTADPFVEAWVEDSGRTFQAAVRAAAPIGHGRLSQWQRASAKGHGTFRKMVGRSFKRAGIDSTSRVRTGPIGNIVRTGSRPHFIKARPGNHLFIPNLGGLFFPSAVHHPGHRGNPFWDRAAAELDARVEPLTRAAGFGTVTKMASNIERKSRRR
jgi:hypothetical protein